MHMNEYVKCDCGLKLNIAFTGCNKTQLTTT